MIRKYLIIFIGLAVFQFVFKRIHVILFLNCEYEQKKGIKKILQIKILNRFRSNIVEKKAKHNYLE